MKVYIDESEAYPIASIEIVSDFEREMGPDFKSAAPICHVNFLLFFAHTLAARLYFWLDGKMLAIREVANTDQEYRESLPLPHPANCDCNVCYMHEEDE